jgi:hypothetical protein
MLEVKPGDVLQARSGLQRVVREVTRYSNGDLRCLTFVIQRCSWTERPYTVINYNDLRYMGYEPVGVTVPLDDQFQQALGMGNEKGSLSCCDVRGIP